MTAAGRRFVWLALLAMVVTACTGGRETPKAAEAGDKPGTGNAKAATPPSQLSLRLSKGTPKQIGLASTQVTEGTKLDDAVIRAVTDRLPAWNGSDTGAKAVNWPAATLVPPRPGRTVETSLGQAPAVPLPPAATAALAVSRVQPQGDVGMAPFVSITFNQPMVPITTLAQLDTRDVPATITPAVAGRWQWIGTQNLRFDADLDDIDRLPMATSYRVEVPAGTKSASGAALADAYTFTFNTPAPKVQLFQPAENSTSLPLDQVFVADFDQRIDPGAALASITLTADDTERMLRLATPAEIEADKTVDVSRLVEGRWLAFRAVDALPANARIVIEIGPGTPSSEGPLRTTSAQRYSMRTYPALTVDSVLCGAGSTSCPPASAAVVRFSNPLDPARFDPASITVSPAIPRQRVRVQGDVVVITGATAARTEYRVTVAEGVVDMFGQSLAEDVTKTFTTTSAQPLIRPFERTIHTLDPFAPKPELTLATVGHSQLRLRVFSVTAQDWSNYIAVWGRVVPGASAPTPGTLLRDVIVPIAGPQDELVETAVDLSADLGGDGLGHLVVVAESTTIYPETSEKYWLNRPAFTWVQATQLGVDLLGDTGSMRVWATDLRTGAPLAGVGVANLGTAPTVTTDDRGLATLGAVPSPTPVPVPVIATRGDDVALSPGWTGSPQADSARWYVMTDRGAYRPGETVSVKGWVRTIAESGDAQLGLPGGGTVGYTVNDAFGVAMGSGSAPLGPLGGFDFALEVPAGANAGHASIQLTTDASAGWSSFRVADYRTPEFEVKTHAEGSEPILSSAPATVVTDVSYYSGGPLGAAPVNWTVTSADTTFAPPGWDGFTFGEWVPWWAWAGDGFGRGLDPFGWPGPVEPPGDVKTSRGTTDAAGHDYLKIDFAGADGALPDLPKRVTVQATITDVNRQQLADDADLVVHAADRYVGLRSARPFVKDGDPLVVEAIVTGIDGKTVAGRPVAVTASRVEPKLVDGVWTDELVDTRNCDTTSTDRAVTCTFETSGGGEYRIVATVVDDHGGRNRSELTLWVAGGADKPARNVQRERLTLVPAKETFAPGEDAEVLVRAPFETGHGIVTVSRAKTQSTVSFEVRGGAAVVRIPVAETDVANLALFFEVVGATQRAGDDGKPLANAPLRPAFATGELRLKVSTASRSLAVTATPREGVLGPGGSTTVDVKVADPAGKPVAGAEFALVVADEAVLALTAYELVDPLTVFYAPVLGQIGQVLGRDDIVLAVPDQISQGVDSQYSGGDAATGATLAQSTTTTTFASASGVAPTAAVPLGGRSADLSEGVDGLGGGGVATPIDVRTNLNALAVYKPSVTTDAAGSATIDVPLPDNLTRYRVMVVAVSGADRFGTAESTITARLPLSVRPSAPRFLNFGDTFELPVVVQNQTDEPLTADVVVEVANLDLTDGAGRRVTVPANDRVEVRFPAKAAKAGAARFRVATAAGGSADAQTVELPVYTPSTTEAFATYGAIDDGAVAQPLTTPTGVIPEFGGLDITTSSTALQGLTDAVIYLLDYPYESADGYASRILTISALRDVLAQFEVPDFSPAQAAQRLAADVNSLVELQNGDGGFGYWRRDGKSEPFVSVEAAHALVLARQGGFAVPQNSLDLALTYLATVESHIPSEYDEASRDAISSYALWVRALAGARDPAKAQELWNRRGDKLGLEAVGWLWPSLDDPAADAAIELRLANSVVETAGAATFTTDYGDAGYLVLHSQRRTDGLVLDSLIARRPQSTLIPKVVTGLLGNRVAGRWETSQENTFILLALKRYFDTYEAQTPDFVARVWLGDRYAGEQPYQGRSTDRTNLHLPTAELVAAGAPNVLVAKEGAGRLYYRVGLRYAPANLRTDPLDRGFVVTRSYEAVDDPADVTLDSKGTWQIKAGARVRVKLSMVAESQRSRVALVDRMPAGFEAVNPELALSPDAPVPDKAEAESRPWWFGPWYDHQNLRDDRAEAFATWLPAGTYDYSYIATATTPGTFVTPAARAEELYAPETFGRSASATVVVR